MSKGWIYQKIAEGKFPAPIQISNRAVGWPSDIIDDWIEERVRENMEGRGEPSDVIDDGMEERVCETKEDRGER